MERRLRGNMWFIIRERRSSSNIMYLNWTAFSPAPTTVGQQASNAQTATENGGVMSRCLDGLPRRVWSSTRVALTALGSPILMRGSGKLEARCGGRHGETVRRWDPKNAGCDDWLTNQQPRCKPTNREPHIGPPYSSLLPDIRKWASKWLSRPKPSSYWPTWSMLLSILSVQNPPKTLTSKTLPSHFEVSP